MFVTFVGHTDGQGFIFDSREEDMGVLYSTSVNFSWKRLHVVLLCGGIHPLHSSLISAVVVFFGPLQEKSNHH